MTGWMGFDPTKFVLTRAGNGYCIHYVHRTREGFRADPNAAGKTLILVPLDGVQGSDYVDAVAQSLDLRSPIIGIIFDRQRFHRKQTSSKSISAISTLGSTVSQSLLSPPQSGSGIGTRKHAAPRFWQRSKRLVPM
jgi:hypothetical protein